MSSKSQQQNKLFEIGRESLVNFSFVQLTKLNTEIFDLKRCATISREIKRLSNSITFIVKNQYYIEKHSCTNTNLLTFSANILSCSEDINQQLEKIWMNFFITQFLNLSPKQLQCISCSFFRAHLFFFLGNRCERNIPGVTSSL